MQINVFIFDKFISSMACSTNITVYYLLQSVLGTHVSSITLHHNGSIYPSRLTTLKFINTVGVCDNSGWGFFKGVPDH